MWMGSFVQVGQGCFELLGAYISVVHLISCLPVFMFVFLEGG